MMKLRSKAFLIIVLCALLSACGDTNVVNSIKFVQTIGYDAVENGVTSSAIIANYEEQGKSKLEFYVTESKSIYDSMPKLNMKLDFPIEYGQLRMALFGERFARKGIKTAIESLIRDPKISSRTHLGVADREALKILNIKENRNDPYFMSDMIEQNIRYGNLPRINLHLTFFDFYGSGRDFFLPHFTVERDELKLDGIALFKEDKFKTKIGIKDSFLMKLLMENSLNGSIMVPVTGSDQAGDEFFLMNSIHSKTRYKVIQTGPPASIAIKVKLEAQVKDVPQWIDLTSKEQIALLESCIETYCQNEIRKFIALLQSNDVDPLGLGDLIRSRTKDWDPQAFQRHYKELSTTVSVTARIIRTGAGG
ncbi:Ger(x)C family germination protein [Paenibacillus sp. BK033]|uniref:Ger(x)C family spore germination protein n=1 Tax=Paenibacillus sp. BK033 TaxID=2512133 RepID=UPI00104F63CA|nr:Ger(x)C family spore germination protein [Paenibacillus sp. BK033]TCN01066.1 Ger(x)C family germination protein [Paenibacillus sp. BK033]